MKSPFDSYEDLASRPDLSILLLMTLSVFATWLVSNIFNYGILMIWPAWIRKNTKSYIGRMCLKVLLVRKTCPDIVAYFATCFAFATNVCGLHIFKSRRITLCGSLWLIFCSWWPTSQFKWWWIDQRRCLTWDEPLYLLGDEESMMGWGLFIFRLEPAN